MMKSTDLHILVTGCAGFIGWKVSEMLLEQGHVVVGVDNLNDAYDVRLKEWRLAQIKDHSNFTFHQSDITDRKRLRALFNPQSHRDASRSAIPNPQSPIRNPKTCPEQGEGFDAVVNLAARAGIRQSIENPWLYFETNVTGTLNLLELCKEYGVKKFILASTSSLYGNAECGTQISDLETIRNPKSAFREDMATDCPLSPYAASKKAAETLCYTYHYLYGIDMTVLRYFTVYGPAGRPDMVPFRLVQWISEGRPVIVYGNGQQSRDFTYVDDIARGTLAALAFLQSQIPNPKSQIPNPQFEIINLGSDQPIVLLDAIRLVEELVGKKARIEYRPRHPADVLATWADISKARALLNWHPHTQFQEGMAQLVSWYQTNREWARTVSTC